MKTVLKHIASYGLTLLLVVSTLQLSIYRMDCLMSGKTKISLTAFEDCNQNEPQKDCSIAQQCCCFHQLDLNFDFDADFSANKEIAMLPAFKACIETNTAAVVPQIATAFHYTDLPPPGGMSLLKEIQVYRL